MVLNSITFIRSIRFFLITLTVLGLISIVGILVPQGLHDQYYHDNYPQIIAQFILKSGWGHVFYSWWFVIPLALFCINLGMCVYTRILTFCRNLFAGKYQPSYDYSSPIICQKRIDVPIEKIRTTAVTFFTKRGYRTHIHYDTNSTTVAGQKGLWGLWGSLLLHCGVLVMISGGIVQHYGGYTFDTLLLRGKPVALGDTQHEVEMKNFFIMENENNELVNYRTELIIRDSAGNVVADSYTEVNKPFAVQGIYFYQMHYGYLPRAVKTVDIMVTGSVSRDTLFSGTIPFGQNTVIIPDSLAVMCDDFACDFVFDRETKQVYNRSEKHHNQAFHMKLFHGDSTILSQWIFSRFSLPHKEQSRYGILVKSYEPEFYSGIMIKKKPGAVLIWISIILMSTGLCLVFLFPFRKFFIVICSDTLHSCLSVYPWQKRADQWLHDEAQQLFHTVSKDSRCSNI